MKILVRESLLAILLVFSAHGLVYFLLAVLPDSSFSGLGIYAGSQEALAQWRLSHANSYATQFANLIHGDLGRSLDNLPVREQILDAALISAPHLAVATVLIAAGVWLVGFKGVPDRYGELLANYVNFLPPYVAISLLVILSLSVAPLLAAQTVVASVALAVPPLALLSAQAYRITEENLRSEHVRMHFALGASTTRVRQRLLKNLLYQLLPSLHNATLALFASLLFVEVLVGIGGLGSLTARAMKRVDVDLALGLVVFYAIVVAGVHVTARVVRAQFPE